MRDVLGYPAAQAAELLDMTATHSTARSSARGQRS